MFCYMYRYRTQPPPIRHPWLSGGLFEHRVQTWLHSERTSRTSKFQTYIFHEFIFEYMLKISLSSSQTSYTYKILTQDNPVLFCLDFCMKVQYLLCKIQDIIYLVGRIVNFFRCNRRPLRFASLSYASRSCSSDAITAAPSPIAVAIWRTVLVRTSPIAYRNGIFVRQSSPARI